MTYVPSGECRLCIMCGEPPAREQTWLQVYVMGANFSFCPECIDQAAYELAQRNG